MRIPCFLLFCPKGYGNMDTVAWNSGVLTLRPFLSLFLELRYLGASYLLSSSSLERTSHEPFPFSNPHKTPEK
jgi:hypothetical protein